MRSYVLCALLAMTCCGTATAAYAQDRTVPAGDVRDVTPPIDIRKKQELGPRPALVAPASAAKGDAPDLRDKGMTDGR